MKTRESRIDYYPFGAEHLNNAQLGHHKPRYRFSGKENQSYYQYSPYTYCANNPMNLVDPYGERIFATFLDGSTWIDYEWMFYAGQWQFVNQSNGLPYGLDGHSNIFIDELTYTLKTIMNYPQGYNYIKELVSIEDAVVIQFSRHMSSLNSYIPHKDYQEFPRKLIDMNGYEISPIGSINWCNPSEVTTERIYKLQVITENGPEINTTIALLHELAHFYYHFRNGIDASWFMIDENTKKEVSLSEIYTTYVENIIRYEQNLPLRTRYLSGDVGKYGGVDIIIDLKNKNSLFYDFESSIYDIYMKLGKK